MWYKCQININEQRYTIFQEIGTSLKCFLLLAYFYTVNFSVEDSLSMLN
jgi:hypothetical protein